MTTKQMVPLPKPVRCDGWRWNGGIFTLGPVKWEQCTADAIVRLSVTQEGKLLSVPACLECWGEAIDRGLKIGKVEPLREAKP